MTQNILLYAILILGLYISLMNWITFFYNVFKKGTISYTPFIGGVLIVAAITVIPFPTLKMYWFIAFFIDFGCIPWLSIISIYSLIRWLKYLLNNLNK